MSTQIVELLLRAKNQTEKVLREVTGNVKDVDKAVESINNKKSFGSAISAGFKNILTSAGLAGAKIDQTIKGMKQVEGFRFNGIVQSWRRVQESIKQSETQLERYNALQQKTDQIGGDLIAASAAPIAIGTAGLSLYAKFSTSVAQVTTLIDDSTLSVEALEREISAVAATYSLNNVEVAEGYYEALSSGAVNAGNANKFMQVAAETAIGGVTTLGTAVDGLTTIINAWKLDTEQAGEASDALFTAAAFGKTDIDALSASISEAAPVAVALGISFDELLAAVAQMTNLGTPTSQAFTRIRAAMDAILGKAEVNAVFKNLGFESAKAAAETNGLKFVLDELVKSVGGNEAELIKMIGSTEALQAVLSLTGDNADAFSKSIDAMENKLGATGRAADKIKDSFGQEFKGVINTASQGFTEIGKTLTPLVTGVGAVLKALVEFITYANNEFPLLTKIIGSTIGALALLALGVGSFILIGGRLFSIIGKVKTVLVAYSAASAGAVTVTTLLARALGPIGMALAVAASVKAIYDLVDAILEYRAIADTAADTSERWGNKFKVLKEQYPNAEDMQLKSHEELISLTKDQTKAYAEQILKAMELNAARSNELGFILDRSEAEQAEYEKRLRMQDVYADAIYTAINLEKLRGATKNQVTEEELRNINTVTTKELEAINKLIQQARAARDTEGLAQLILIQQQYQELLQLSANSMAALGKESKDVTVDLGLMAASYAKTTEAVADFQSQALQGVDFRLATTLSDLDLLEQKLQNALAAKEIDTAEFNAQFKELIDQRLAAEQEANTDRLDVAKQTAVALKKVAESELSNDIELKKRLREIQRDYETDVIDSTRTMADAVKNSRSAAFNNWQKYAQQVIDLQNQIKNTEIEAEQAIRELRREGLNEFEQYKDRQREITELNAQLEKSLAEGNFDVAADIARRQISLARSLSSEVEVNNQTQISKQQAVSNAVSATSQAYDNLKRVQTAQKDEAVKAADQQRLLFERLDGVLVKLNNTLAALIGNSELKIDATVNESEVYEQLSRIDNIAKQGVETPMTTKLDPGSTANAVAGVGQARDEAQQKYGKITVTAVGDTGDVIRSLQTIESKKDWTAQVMIEAIDGKYYSVIRKIEGQSIVAQTAPELVKGSLDKFRKDVEDKIRDNPPEAFFALDDQVTNQNAEKGAKGFINVAEKTDAVIAIDANSAPAKDTLNGLIREANAIKTRSLHDINVDNIEVERARQRNSQNTYSTHFIRVVEQRAGGGLIGSFPRRNGFIRGPGGPTDDKVPAMLSNEEFVVKARAVRHYGAGFMNLINNMQLPHFATGGLVGATGAGIASNIEMSEETLRLIFDVGGKSYPVKTQDSVGRALVAQLQKESKK